MLLALAGQVKTTINHTTAKTTSHFFMTTPDKIKKK